MAATSAAALAATMVDTLSSRLFEAVSGCSTRTPGSFLVTAAVASEVGAAVNCSSVAQGVA